MPSRRLEIDGRHFGWNVVPHPEAPQGALRIRIWEEGEQDGRPLTIRTPSHVPALRRRSSDAATEVLVPGAVTPGTIRSMTLAADAAGWPHHAELEWDRREQRLRIPSETAPDSRWFGMTYYSWHPGEFPSSSSEESLLVVWSRGTDALAFWEEVCRRHGGCPVEAEWRELSPAELQSRLRIAPLEPPTWPALQLILQAWVMLDEWDEWAVVFRTDDLLCAVFWDTTA